MSNKIIWILLLLVAITGCKKKQIPPIEDALAESEIAWLNTTDYFKIDPPIFDSLTLSHLSFKSRFSIESTLATFEDVSVTMRVKEDSLIWLSASHLGFEVVRALIAPDSIRILNRFQKQYITSDYAFVSKKLGITLGYPQLQAILLGDFIYPPSATADWFAVDDSTIVYQDKKSLVHMQGTVGRKEQRVYDLQMQHTKNGDFMTMVNRQFQQVGTQFLPLSSTLYIDRAKSSIKPNEQIKLSLEHQKIETLSSSASYPFAIPNNYKRIVL